MNRMREHLMSEIDKDKDRMVSLQEFIGATQQKEFDKNEEWKVCLLLIFFCFVDNILKITIYRQLKMNLNLMLKI
jgi:hypothetical protein